MTRIIAGFAGSISIAVPGSGTRPTSDRVREAIFSALEARDAIHGARVLDLYAGSGALGLEAASRGATHITLVDLAIDAVRANAAKVLKQAPADAQPIVLPVARAVQSFLDSATDTWDLVFLDPPYSMPSEEVGHNLAALAPRLEPGALVIVERGSRSSAPSWTDGLSFERRKDYGDTALYWLSA
ncbi:MAG: 16S rRNA (guanine(966)-N(2))-methyltransferase RsmD [Salinibacterium sp.]|nr:MAG: 16S rRNA (guanine(966)-N(2))-methyltransferase RsmD [Salinibacterium sp.]